MDNRAVSDVLGFILIFSLISVTIGIIYVSGVGGLDDTRDAERVNNAERAFDVMAHNIGDITQHGAPSRATEVRLDDAQLSVNEEVYVEYNFINASGISEYAYNVSIKPIVYSSHTGTDLVYEGGAVIRHQSDTSRMVNEPMFILDGDQPMVLLVRTWTPTNEDVGGSKTVRVRAIHDATTLDQTGDDEPYKMWLNVTSPRSEAWESYFNDDGSCAEVVTDDNTVACRLDGVQKGSVTTIRTTIEIE
ncbi:hypothetical protein [Haladaptatus sp. DJG-WS-42]|uniref:DUF7289 family protein n=1 Tax=Haladaptatus sp. DJG-WS-42 TaxID=3120516 RepID=UPI0030CE651E